MSDPVPVRIYRAAQAIVIRHSNPHTEDTPVCRWADAHGFKVDPESDTPWHRAVFVLEAAATRGVATAGRA